MCSRMMDCWPTNAKLAQASGRYVLLFAIAWKGMNWVCARTVQFFGRVPVGVGSRVWSETCYRARGLVNLRDNKTHSKDNGT